MGEKVTVQNGYTFTTDTETGTVTARGELQAQKAPRSHLNAEKAGLLMTEGTQKGHLVPAQDNGPTTAENISAQHKDLNQSTVKKVENAERRLMADKENPAKIQTERIAFANNQRKDGKIQPDAYMFNDQITYADGTKDTVHLSFTNISKKQQEGLKAEMEAIPVPEMPNPGDTLRKRMDPKEYARLMEATDRELPDIRTEFEKADTKKGKDKVQNMADRESFLKSIEVSPEVKARLAQVSKDHAAKESKGKKTSADDGGRERSDSRDGRESGYKSGSKEGTKEGAKNGAKDGTKASADQGGKQGTVQGARAAAQGAKSAGAKGGKSGAAQGARAAAGGEKGGRGAAASGGSRGGKAGAAAAAASAGGKSGAASGGRGGSSGGHGGSASGGGHGGGASGGGASGGGHGGGSSGGGHGGGSSGGGHGGHGGR